MPVDTKSISLMDYITNDAYLKDSENPLVAYTITNYWSNMMDATSKYLGLEEKTAKLASASREGEKFNLADFLVPEDKKVFKYIESENKTELAQTLSKEQLEFANFVIDNLAKMRDYLIENQQLEKYRNNYITHIDKSFLEKVKNY